MKKLSILVSLVLQFSIVGFVSSMQVFIQISPSETISIDVEGSTTIQAVKLIIQEREGFLLENQSLFFDGVELENNRTLADLNIMQGSTLILVLSRPIPTLSQWGIIVLLMFMAILGILIIKTKRCQKSAAPPFSFL